MTKLRPGTIIEDKPVKVTAELPALLLRDLIAYAEVIDRNGSRICNCAAEATTLPVRHGVPTARGSPFPVSTLMMPL